MSDRQTHIIKRLRVAGVATSEFFRSIAADSFQQQIYSTGGEWLLRDVLAHFVSIEHTFLNYGREILAGGEGAPEDFDIDEYNEVQIALKQHQEPDELLVAFENARKETIVLVESMKDSDLDREGRHPYFGFLALEKMLKLIYRHNMIHERDIRRAFNTGAPADAA